MPVKARKFCRMDRRVTLHTYYADYRPGAPNEYWQCEMCGSCWYKCKVHRTFTASRATDAQAGCECHREDEVAE